MCSVVFLFYFCVFPFFFLISMLPCFLLFFMLFLFCFQVWHNCGKQSRKVTSSLKPPGAHLEGSAHIPFNQRPVCGMGLAPTTKHSEFGAGRLPSATKITGSTGFGPSRTQFPDSFNCGNVSPPSMTSKHRGCYSWFVLATAACGGPALQPVPQKPINTLWWRPPNLVSNVRQTSLRILGYLLYHETWMFASKTTWKKTKYGRGEPQKNTFALKHIRFTQGSLHLPAAWMY